MLSEGTFTVTDADGATGYCILIDADDVALVLSPGAIIKLADNTLDGSEITNLIRIGDGTNTRDGVLITGGGTVDGNATNNTTSGSITDGAAIRIDGPNTNVKVSGITIQNGPRDAVFIEGTAANDRAENIVLGELHNIQLL